MIERDYYGNDEKRSDLQSIRDRTRQLRQRQLARQEEDMEKQLVGQPSDKKDVKQKEEEVNRQIQSGYRSAQLGRKCAYAEDAEKQARQMASKTKGRGDDARADSVEEMLEGSVFDPNSTMESMWDAAEDYVGRDDGPDF